MVEGIKFIGIMEETIWLEQACVGIVLLTLSYFGASLGLPLPNLS